MADVFQPAPTWADVVIIDETTQKAKFNPVWLNWFLQLVQILDALGGTSAGSHNSLTGLQGGSASERYHLTSAQEAVAAALANPVTVATGGTGATTAAGARTNLGLGTMAVQNANGVAITGGAIDGTPVGGTTRAAGAFTTLSASTTFLLPKDDATAQTAVRLYAGAGVPNNANGTNGDFYFRSDGAAGTFIYQKSGGTWTGIA